MGLPPTAREARAWGIMAYVLAFGAFVNITFLWTGSAVLDGHTFLACLGAVVAVALLAVVHGTVRVLAGTALALIAGSLAWTLTAEVGSVANDRLVSDLLMLWLPVLVGALVVVASRRNAKVQVVIGTVVALVLTATILGTAAFAQVQMAEGADLLAVDAVASISMLSCELLLLVIAGATWWQGPASGGWSSAREAALLIWAHIALTAVPMALLFARGSLSIGMEVLQSSYAVRIVLFILLISAAVHLVRSGIHLGRSTAGWVAGVMLVAGTAVSLAIAFFASDPLRLELNEASFPLMISLAGLHLGTVLALLNWMRAMATTAGDPTTESFANVGLGGVLLAFVAAPMVAIGPAGVITYVAYLVLLVGVVMVAWARLLLHADRQVRAGRRMARSERAQNTASLGGLNVG